MRCHRGHLHEVRTTSANGVAAVDPIAPVTMPPVPADPPRRSPDGHPPARPRSPARDASPAGGAVGAGGGGGPSRLMVSVGVALASTAAAAIARRFTYGPMRSTPPVPARLPHTIKFGKVDGEARGDNLMDPPRTGVDDLYWLRDDARADKDVIAHLKAENAYTNFVTKDQRGLRKRIYQEMLSHVQQTDEAAPYKVGGFLYYTRTVEGKAYALYCRKAIVGLDAVGTVGGVTVPDEGQVTWADDALGGEEVYLDANVLAKGAKHFDVRSVSPSPDHAFVAYSVDVTGYETYEVRVRHIATGVERPVDTIKETSGGMEWGRDNTTLFYATLDEAHRQNKVWRRTFASRDADTGASALTEPVDDCLHTEDDEVFSAFVSKSVSDRFMFFGSGSSETSEVHWVDLDAEAAARAAGAPVPPSVLVEPRVSGVLYDVTHAGGETLLVVTNRGGATNFKLAATSVGAPGAATWADVLPYDAAVKVDSVECFERYAVLHLRKGGFTRLSVVPLTGDGDGPRTLDIAARTTLDFEEEAYVVSGAFGAEFHSRSFRFGYSSMTTPQQTWAYDGVTHARTLLKEKPVPAYDRSLYRSERWEATADDGTVIPMSAVYRIDKRTAAGTSQATHLYGYGSYEISIDPSFSATMLPLLDRGVIYVVAHVRGGGEMGRTWYESAKFGTKVLTFTDFIACGRSLVERRVTSPAQLTIEGRSAGGLLVGAVLNMAPDLFNGAIAGVPFVDVLTTMADSSIPLSCGEWLEWGNPNTAKGFKDIAAYSPVDNVRDGVAYPAVLFTAGLNDPRVGYWEAAKMVVKLRAATTADARARPIIFKCDLDSGHFSASDRYKYWRERSFELAWLLARHGMHE